MNLEGLEDQAKLQMMPKMTQGRQNPRPKLKHKEIKTRYSGKPPDHHHQWPPRVDRGGHHGLWWLPWPARGGSQGRGGWKFPSCFGLFFTAVRLPTRIVGFACKFASEHVLGRKKAPNSSHSILHFDS